MKKKSFFSKYWGWFLFLFLIIIMLILGFIFWGKIVLFLTGLVPQSFNNNSGGSGGGNSVYSCTDSDEGLSYYMVGHATDQDNLKYYDKCEDNVLLKEYYCSNNKVTIRDYYCPLGYKCTQTRSGGFCDPINQGSNGDVIGTGSGSGSITGGFLPATTIDLNAMELIPGNCGLTLQLNTAWSYQNPAVCQGIQGADGLIWQVFDSSSLYWQRIDAVPTGLGVQLPCGMNWDGSTDWKIMVGKTLNIPNCNIDYEYDYSVVLCNCQ